MDWENPSRPPPSAMVRPNPPPNWGMDEGTEVVFLLRL